MILPVLGFFPTPLLGQTTGTITGTVVDAESGQTLESAQVYIPALNKGGLTNPSGRFLLLNVPAGQHELRAEIIGYADVTQSITVAAGQTLPVIFEMAGTVLQLQELVVTGVAGSTPRVKLPFTVEKMDVNDMPVPAPSVGGLLAGKLPGVRVTSGLRWPGEEPSIMLRNPTTITGSQRPLIIVDGVITDNSLADIDALDIESVEVVKGAAAASLYGSRAQAGVIQFTTKRGAGLRTDQSRLTLRTEVGKQDLTRGFPRSIGHPYKIIDGSYVDQDNKPIPLGPGIVLETGNNATTFQDNHFLDPTFDQLEQFFDPGEFMSQYVALEGKTPSTNYRASFSFSHEDGVYDESDGFTRRNFRLNLDHSMSESLTVSVNSFFATSAVDFSSQTAEIWDLIALSPAADLLATDPDGTLTNFPDPTRAFAANPLYAARHDDNTKDRQRFMGSALVRWSPLSWFNVEGNYSVDRADVARTNLRPKGFKASPDEPTLGELTRRNQIDTDINASLTASITKTFGDLTTRSRLRILLEDQTREWFAATGNDFAVAEVPVLDNVSGPKVITSQFIDIVSKGFFAITGIDYQGKYIGDVLFRRDGSSLFGPEERWQNYFRGSFAWRVAQEPWWPLDFVDEFKLRYSWGQAGGRPQFEAQYETYTVSNGVITPQALGNEALRPELSTEQEIGIEFVLWSKLSGGFTYVESRTEDQLLQVPLAGFAGFTSQWRNAATIEGNIYEAYLEASLIETPDLSWSTRVNFDRSRHEITEMSTPPFRQFFDFFWVKPGVGLGTVFGTRWAEKCSDLPSGADCDQFSKNDEGFLVPVGAGHTWKDGIALDLWGTTVDGGGDAGILDWGIPIAGHEDGETFLEIVDGQTAFALSWSNSLRWKQLSLYTLFDSEQGLEIYNGAKQRAYGTSTHRDCDMVGRDAELKKPLVYCSEIFSVGEKTSAFVEDGSYIKFREASLRYTLTGEQLGSLGPLDQVSISLIGRNLFTWTDYTGFDPEVGGWLGPDGNVFASAVTARIDNTQPPNFRTLTVAVELVF